MPEHRTNAAAMEAVPGVRRSRKNLKCHRIPVKNQDKKNPPGLMLRWTASTSGQREVAAQKTLDARYWTLDIRH